MTAGAGVGISQNYDSCLPIKFNLCMFLSLDLHVKCTGVPT